MQIPIGLGVNNQTFKSNSNQESNLPQLEGLMTKFIGGSGDEWGGISKIDPQNNLILAGESGSSELTLK